MRPRRKTFGKGWWPSHQWHANAALQIDNLVQTATMNQWMTSVQVICTIRQNKSCLYSDWGTAKRCWSSLPECRRRILLCTTGLTVYHPSQQTDYSYYEAWFISRDISKTASAQDKGIPKGDRFTWRNAYATYLLFTAIRGSNLPLVSFRIISC